ncbi:DUF397 domain-containing protein [Dactylosporangium roseum]|uniref:DUF397 domain-containing protein n=1 Tax=Dactylosporangium roseum TaxID=47989 RepID=A0ABY5Z8K7_9ACTN|nr:DUF397 domain-containing protein [Dactylosporangium roseum]UWZ37891.1 DUF397 domain-containing protein [Dactylosporangium roseum]
MLTPNQPHISTRCASSACVQVTLTDKVTVDDTKDGGEKTAFDVEAWTAFVAAVKRDGLEAVA